MSENKSKYIRWFEETTIDDVPLVGGKNAFLGEMRCTGSYLKRGVRAPNWTKKSS